MYLCIYVCVYVCMYVCCMYHACIFAVCILLWLIQSAMAKIVQNKPYFSRHTMQERPHASDVTLTPVPGGGGGEEVPLKFVLCHCQTPQDAHMSEKNAGSGQARSGPHS